MWECNCCHKTNYEVRGCNTTTSAPLSTPSPFFRTQRPKRISCPTHATSSSDFAFVEPTRVVLPSASITSPRLAQPRDETVLGGQEMNWREFTTPRAGMLPTSENDLIFASSFHRRISPSHDPTRDAVDKRHFHEL